MEPVITWLKDVKPEEVEWLWPGRIPQNKLVIVGGEPEMGKSFLTCHIASCVSRGAAWPDGGLAPQGKVLLLASEDGLEDTIAPRLIAEEADLDQIAAIEGFKGPVGVESTCLKLHYMYLSALVEDIKPTILVIDPINNYMGKTDGSNNIEVRAVLQPLVELASALRVTILLVHHFNKNRNLEVRQRFAGSAAYLENVRAAMAVMPGKREEIKRLITVKSNLAEKPADLQFRINGGRVEWMGLTTVARNLDQWIAPGAPDAGAPSFGGRYVEGL